MDDHIRGADSDSGFTLDLECPACRGKHRVALARLDGRFAFSCGVRTMVGKVENWTDLKLAAAAAKHAEQKETQT
jgi:hypothetical protein